MVVVQWRCGGGLVTVGATGQNHSIYYLESISYWLLAILMPVFELLNRCVVLYFLSYQGRGQGAAWGWFRAKLTYINFPKLALALGAKTGAISRRMQLPCHVGIHRLTELFGNPKNSDTATRRQ